VLPTGGRPWAGPPLPPPGPRRHETRRPTGALWWALASRVGRATSTHPRSAAAGRRRAVRGWRRPARIGRGATVDARVGASGSCLWDGMQGSPYVRQAPVFPCTAPTARPRRLLLQNSTSLHPGLFVGVGRPSDATCKKKEAAQGRKNGVQSSHPSKIVA